MQGIYHRKHFRYTFVMLSIYRTEKCPEGQAGGGQKRCPGNLSPYIYSKRFPGQLICPR